MGTWLNRPSFAVYATTCVILSGNLLFVWGYSGFTRAKTKVAINKEDAERVGTKLETTDPPEVARVLRVHANAQATYTRSSYWASCSCSRAAPEPSPRWTSGSSSPRELPTRSSNLAGKQPWRTLAFVAGGVAMIALMGNIVWMVSRGRLDADQRQPPHASPKLAREGTLEAGVLRRGRGGVRCANWWFFDTVSLDGYFVDSSGDMSWAHKDDPEWNGFAADNASTGGALVFGRITYELMASFWPTP
jgi:prostaglandin-E synthase 1